MQIKSIVGKVAPYMIPISIMLLVVFLLGRMQLHRSQTDSDYAREKGNPLPVRVYHADVGPISQSMPAACVTKANPLLRIEGQIHDRVVATTMVKVGDQISSGTVLNILENEPERLAIQRNRELLKAMHGHVQEHQARVDYFSKIRTEGLGLERDLRQALVELTKARAELTTAESDLRDSEAELRKTKVVSPTSGVVMDIAKAGEKSRKDGGLATIAVTHPLLVECQLPEERLLFLRPGLDVRTSFPSRPGESYQAKLIRVDSAHEDTAHTILVSFELPNNSGKLLPGLHGLADISNEQQGLRIPSIALLNPRQDIAQVIVIDAQNVARLQRISIGGSANGYTQVLGGLQAGAQVVVAGQLGLREGDKVRIAIESSSDTGK